MISKYDAGMKTTPLKPKKWSVYVLECGDGSLYVGATTDVAARVKAHNAGKGGKYTRSHLPVKAVHVERCASRGAALTREAEIKRWTRQKKLALISDVT